MTLIEPVLRRIEIHPVKPKSALNCSLTLDARGNNFLSGRSRTAQSNLLDPAVVYFCVINQAR